MFFFLKNQVFKHDYKPKQLCQQCLLKLNDFYQFLSLSHTSDEKFNSMLSTRWPNETILDYTQQKMSVIVGVKDSLDCHDIDLYKESVIPLENCPINENEMLEIVENATYSNIQNLDYLNPNYMKKYQTGDFYQEPTVLRNPSYHQDNSCSSNVAINYTCQNLSNFEKEQDFPQELSYNDAGIDYSNYTARPRDAVPPYPSCSQLNQTLVKKVDSIKQKTFSCPHCERKFKRRVTLNAHIAIIHTKIRPYTCVVCKKSFAIKSDLTNHLKIHTDLNKCTFCKRSFSVPSKLQRHLRTHTKDKPFFCDFKGCDKSFSDKCNLDGHRSVHLDVFNFKCEECGKVFRRKSRLKQHEKTHSSPSELFVCEICSKGYKYKSTLVVHLKKHSGYFCSYCDKNCGGPVKLVKHKKVCLYHPDNEKKNHFI